MIELAKKSASVVRKGRTDVDALRIELREMHAELENAKSEILAHLAARREAEEERDAWRRRFERLRRSAGEL